MGQRVNLISKFNQVRVDVVKAHLKKFFKFIKLDPKLSDLVMNRLKAL